MKRYFFTLLCSLTVLACSKDKKETDQVWVRLENATGFTLEDARIGEVSYGNVMAGQITEYKQVNDPVYTGYCSFKKAGNQSGAGYGICGTPPLPPPFEPAYYTFKVESTGTGFNPVTVIKR